LSDEYKKRRARAAVSPLPPGDPRHGTRNGYTNLLCRCDKCRRAWALYVQSQKLRRAAAGLPEDDPHHGTQNGYGNYGCRCVACSAAWAKGGHERYARRRERKRIDGTGRESRG
jgi:hypothetical protein